MPLDNYIDTHTNDNIKRYQTINKIFTFTKRKAEIQGEQLAGPSSLLFSPIKHTGENCCNFSGPKIPKGHVRGSPRLHWSLFVWASWTTNLIKNHLGISGIIIYTTKSSTKLYMGFVSVPSAKGLSWHKPTQISTPKICGFLILGFWCFWIQYFFFQ